MDIIFDERKLAKDIMENGLQNIGKSRYHLLLVAAYMREQKRSEQDIDIELRRLAKNFFLDYVPDKFTKISEERIRKSKNYKMNINNDIVITQAELDTILGEKEEKVRNVMFVYLVLAKFYRSNYEIDKYYVPYSDTDIFKLCDIYTRKSERLDIMHYLTNKGYISPTLAKSSIVLYVNENSPVVLKFKPDIDMIYYFEKYQGGIFINCENCGRLVKKTNNRIKYCKECSLKKKKELNSIYYKENLK